LVRAQERWGRSAQAAANAGAVLSNPFAGVDLWRRVPRRHRQGRRRRQHLHSSTPSTQQAGPSALHYCDRESPLDRIGRSPPWPPPVSKKKKQSAGRSILLIRTLALITSTIRSVPVPALIKDNPIQFNHIPKRTRTQCIYGSCSESQIYVF
jgi:hypothetical protein